MRTTEIKDGKKWIEETTKRVATEYYRAIDNLKWKSGKEGIEKEMYSLVFSIDKVRYAEIFSEEDLSGLPKSPDIKMKVEGRLRHLMKSIK